MKGNEKEYFDYTIIFAITNTIVMVVLYSLSIYFIFLCIKGVIIKIILCIAALPICVEFEYQCLMKIINPIVDIFIPKKWKQAEAEWFASCRQHKKIEKMTKSRGTGDERLKSMKHNDTVDK